MNHEELQARFCTVPEASEILGVEQEKVLEMIISGELQERKIKHCSDLLIHRFSVECMTGGVNIKT